MDLNFPSLVSIAPRYNPGRGAETDCTTVLHKIEEDREAGHAWTWTTGQEVVLPPKKRLAREKRKGEACATCRKTKRRCKHQRVESLLDSPDSSAIGGTLASRTHLTYPAYDVALPSVHVSQEEAVKRPSAVRLVPKQEYRTFVAKSLATQPSCISQMPFRRGTNARYSDSDCESKCTSSQRITKHDDSRPSDSRFPRYKSHEGDKEIVADILQQDRLHRRPDDLLRVCKECSLEFSRSSDLDYHMECVRSHGSCGFIPDHRASCTGHHPPSNEREYQAFEHAVLNWEQAQLQASIATIDGLVSRPDRQERATSFELTARSESFKMLSEALIGPRRSSLDPSDSLAKELQDTLNLGKIPQLPKAMQYPGEIQYADAEAELGTYSSTLLFDDSPWTWDMNSQPAAGSYSLPVSESSYSTSSAFTDVDHLFPDHSNDHRALSWTDTSDYMSEIAAYPDMYMPAPATTTPFDPALAPKCSIPISRSARLCSALTPDSSVGEVSALSWTSQRSTRQRAPTSTEIHRCRKCETSFSKPADLKHHQRRHLGSSQRPVKCSECDKTFLYHKDLRRHQQALHVERRVRFHCQFAECAVGSRGYSRADHLKRHLATKHGGAN